MTCYFVCSRNTVKELPGNDRVSAVPVKLTGDNFGETFVGSARAKLARARSGETCSSDKATHRWSFHEV